MGLSTTTHTVNDVLTDVKRTFGDESAVQVSDADIMRWINSGQREILITNRVLKAIGTADIVGGQSAYPLAALNVIAIQSIRYNGKKLEFRSFQDAEEYITASDPQNTLQGDPILWYEWAGVINLYPVPSNDLPGGLTVYYIREPTPVTSANDALSVPDSYYENVLQYVLSKAYELDEDSENSQFKLGQFQQRLDTLSEQDSNSNQDVYPTITIREEDM